MIKNAGFNFDNSYARLPDSLFVHAEPMPVKSPQLVLVNEPLSRELGLDFSGQSREDMALLFAGNLLPEGAEPLAQAYAGHQFGNFTMLGDGRAVLWGEHIAPDDTRHDIQLKGSGRTSYSRGGDGRAALGPMLREYIISEAMHQLGIPTTRSLAVATTGEQVFRETALPGAVLTRVAASHIRVGTFQFAAARREEGLVEALLDHTVRRHYPELDDSDEKATALLKQMMHRQADLIVDWMRVGFIHGVMNTDNVTLSGETIDYGPCAFMDEYDPNTVFSSIDQMGRYAYANQARIAQWNLARFAETLLPLINEDLDQAVPVAEGMLNEFPEIYHDKWLAMMRAKLGLFGEREGDEALATDLLRWMHTHNADFTNTFRDLSREQRPEGQVYNNEGFDDWYQRWQARLEQNSKPLKSSLCLMNNSNPAVIPRNHKVDQVLTAAEAGDFQPLSDLLKALEKPYTENDRSEAYRTPPAPEERVHQTFCGT
jgi:uncharacterized protein YdiU (UPF0061 family)